MPRCCGGKHGGRCHGKFLGGSPTAAGSTKKITNSAQKPIFCALFYSQGPPISSTDAEFYSRRSTFHFKSPAPLASEHKNGDFVLEMPENRGPKPQKRTKTSILCSKTLKTGLPKAKSAQKPRFCAREEGDWQWEEKILASESATVAFLQITAHAFKMQMLHNQIINF